MERQVRIIMETSEVNYEETKNDSPDAEILENDEETSEITIEGTEETNETGEETTETGEETSDYESITETQVLVSVNTNHGLDDNISSFSYETVVLTIIMLILGAMLIGGFYHEQ